MQNHLSFIYVSDFWSRNRHLWPLTPTYVLMRQRPVILFRRTTTSRNHSLVSTQRRAASDSSSCRLRTEWGSPWTNLQSVFSVSTVILSYTFTLPVPGCHLLINHHLTRRQIADLPPSGPSKGDGRLLGNRQTCNPNPPDHLSLTVRSLV